MCVQLDSKLQTMSNHVKADDKSGCICYDSQASDLVGAGRSSSQLCGQSAQDGAALEAAGGDQALPVWPLLVLLTLCD